MKPSLPDSLCKILVSLQGITVAYSGGLDSRFLIHSARLCGVPVRAVHAIGPHIPTAESSYAKRWATENDVPLQIISHNPLGAEEIRMNRRDRCYACKKLLFGKMSKMVDSMPLCDGSQADDLHSFRPGRRALDEFQILSPLAMAGLDKATIRNLARHTGLEWWEQKAAPCLLTRIKYDHEINPDLLARIAVCEEALASELPDAEYRLRIADIPVVQISGSWHGEKDRIKNILDKFGFGGFEVLECDEVSGYFDK